MKVYLIVQYSGDISRVLDVHATKEGAEKQAARINDSLELAIFDGSIKEGATTIHILKKSVKGLKGIKFEIHGKERYLMGTVGRAKPKPKKMSQHKHNFYTIGE